MISYDNLLFIKENLVLINILTGVFSFMLGIAPLLIDRESLEKQSKPIIIEFTAFIFLLYTIAVVCLGYISKKPLFKENSCIKHLEHYYIDNEFKEFFYLNDKLFIKKIGEENYLLYNLNNKIYYKMSTTEDYKYQKVNCRK